MMNLRARTLWYSALAAVAFASAVSSTLLHWPNETVLQAQEPPEGDKLPPLVIDADEPLLLEEPKDLVRPDKPVAPSVAENSACYVCHENLQTEELVTQHVAGDTGCVDCHGKSYDHRNDENNTTPPDVMFPRGNIDAACLECHETHDAPAAKVVARLRERAPRMSESEQLVCTDCHGFHRLNHRTVVWDRASRVLLTGKQDAPAHRQGPTLEMLKALAGNWVQVGENGQPGEQVISTYRVTAAGSAVEEVLFPGTDHEMVTMYHHDGDNLLLTHYCAAGNQPRMKARNGTNPGELVFEFMDATNLRSPADPHMHAGSITIVDANHLRAQWDGYQDGKPNRVASFDLVRKKP
jgi:hypothetical protein